jgi:hypothetical protein
VLKPRGGGGNLLKYPWCRIRLFVSGGVISQRSVSAMNTWNGWRNTSLQGERSDVFTASPEKNCLIQPVVGFEFQFLGFNKVAASIIGNSFNFLLILSYHCLNLPKSLLFSSSNLGFVRFLNCFDDFSVNFIHL